MIVLSRTQENLQQPRPISVQPENSAVVGKVAGQVVREGLGTGLWEHAPHTAASSRWRGSVITVPRGQACG